MTDDAPLRQPTRLLDFTAGPIRDLIERRGWSGLFEHDRIGAASDLVRNEILFGYNCADDIPASEVPGDGYGQCNTKATLLMSLLRRLGVPWRLHGFTIHKALQRGLLPEAVYPLAPAEILHSWIEVRVGGAWLNLEGFILDTACLERLQAAFPEAAGLCGYGAGTDCLGAPPVAWRGGDTCIQKTGIARDLGTFDAPDDFHQQHRQTFARLRGWPYRRIIRHWMTARATAIRAGRLVPSAVRTPHEQGETHHAA